ncbi:germ cell nuclear acidic-1 protein-like [Dermacentor albipictus]|uniref:germ cell nuclear acidic-1 protein-like n=1 Tax=Dermacentor albipictus TaxID=60249 RepID=UPI0031FE1D39
MPVSMACDEKLSEAFENALRLSPKVKDAPNFLTPQKRPLLGRHCWSSARRRPSFLNSSSSEDELKTPVERKERKPAVPSRVVTPCATAKALLDEDAWFLESLSDSTPLDKCHPDTLKFRQRFKDSREDLSNALFLLFNREIFAHKLPPGEISWNSRLTSTAGRCFNLADYNYRVELSAKILHNAEYTRDTLLHELCHAAVWVNRAAQRFPKLPPGQRCHNYKQSRSRKLTFN